MFGYCRNLKVGALHIRQVLRKSIAPKLKKHKNLLFFCVNNPNILLLEEKGSRIEAHALKVMMRHYFGANILLYAGRYFLCALGIFLRAGMLCAHIRKLCSKISSVSQVLTVHFISALNTFFAEFLCAHIRKLYKAKFLSIVSSSLCTHTLISYIAPFSLK